MSLNMIIIVVIIGPKGCVTVKPKINLKIYNMKSRKKKDDIGQGCAEEFKYSTA